MNNLLIFFAFPVATIIFAVALQKTLRAPFLVAAVVFAAFLIVTFAVFDETFLVYAILYALLALITALLTRFICCLIRNSDNPCINGNANASDNDNNNDCDCGCNNRNSDDSCDCSRDRSFLVPYSYSRNRFIRR
jgi:hypothetical protein